MKKLIGKTEALLLELPLLALGILLQSAKILELVATESGEGYMTIWHYVSTAGLICILLAFAAALIAIINDADK